MQGADENPWRRVRLAAAVFAVTALAGAGAAVAALWHEHGVADELKRVEVRLAEAHRRYSDLADEGRQRRRHESMFHQWAARGRIGGKEPGTWEQAIRNASPEVLSASHRTSQPRVVEMDGGVEVRATDTTVELRLRHEAELLDYLAALVPRIGDLFTVSGCRLSRSGTEGTDAPTQARIDASCRLRQQTVHLIGVEPGWLPPAAQDNGDDARSAVPVSQSALSPAPGREFGRLFNTAEERARIESAAVARALQSPPPGNREPPTVRESPPSPPQWVDFNGLVAGSGESVFAWFDGRRADQGPRPALRTSTPGSSSHGVRLEAGGRWIAVRPGQRFDPATGEVIDRIGRNAVRFERAGFLRKSSRAPLRVLPDPGQN